MTSRSKKNLIRTSATLLSVVVLLLLSVFVFLKRSLAPLDGQETLKNLSAPVEISRDDYGIPHISAQNKTDALRALGFVMASERLFQMEMSRHLTQGTLAEVVGDIALPSDKLYRSLAIRQSVEKMLAEQNHPQDLKMQSEMEAFCDGINQYVNTHPLPYEFAILGLHHLQPFTPMNAYIMTGHMAFSFGVALKNDVLMTSLAKKISTNKLHDLQNDRFDSPLKVADAFATLKPLLIAGENFAPAFDGSNAWLLGPQRSSSGKSIFANDPHIGFSHPSVWFEAAIHTPEFEVYGHYLPLIPFAVLGHTRHHAWGFTMSQTDDMDLYRETLDRTHKLVMFKKKWQPYKEWQEIIHVKNNPDVIVPMIETEHGPLLDAAMEEPGLALKWAFHNSHNDPLAALRQMAEAKNIHEFENSLKTGTAPGLNVMYADSENIATWMFGEVALKKNPNSDFILDGASGNDEYLRTLTWEEKPHMINPPSGVIVSANTRP
ncbi:MAG TPA: penicillin acylase family protein, partial [Bdellovibrio sp.]|nr:penicillin acylase family protein [Bdellovibrio sp.]